MTGPKTFAGVLCLMSLWGSLIYAEDDSTIRVMSFNIRLGTAPDGENDWDHRRELVVETIRGQSPDLLGTQETLLFQEEYLAEHLPEYEVFGAGRDDGQDKGERMTILYRRDRFTRVDGGHYWLSATPDVPGSKSWDSSLPRMVTWLKLRDGRATGEPVVWFANTHFDHRGGDARAESAKIIRDRVARDEGRSLFVLTGDFNAGDGSLPWQILFRSDPTRPVLLRDTYRVVQTEAVPGEGTYHGYQVDQRSGARIDWIACSQQFTVLEAGIDHTSGDGRLPSDHFPVWALLQYPE